MTMKINRWLLLSIAVVAALTALAFLGTSYRTVWILLLPAGLWLNLKREPGQKHLRPVIRVIGWIFIGVACTVAVLLLVQHSVQSRVGTTHVFALSERPAILTMELALAKARETLARD